MRRIDDPRGKRRKRSNARQEATPATETSEIKRLTLDLPEVLHRTIKRNAVEQGVTMAQMLRALLLKHYKINENAG